MKILLALLLTCLVARAAQTTIGNLPLIDPASTNAVSEVEDPAATPRSRKVVFGNFPWLNVFGVPGGSNYMNQLSVPPGSGSAISNGVYATIFAPRLTFSQAWTPAANDQPHDVFYTDVITTSGTGDYCSWDGTVWRTREGVQCTTDIKTFILYSRQSGLIKFTSVSDVYTAVNGTWLGSLLGVNTATLNGGDNSSGGYLSTTYGNFLGFGTGGANNGQGGEYGGRVPAPSANEYWSFGAGCMVSALASVADAYYVKFGTDSSGTADVSRTGAFFMYDPIGAKQTTLGSINYTNVATAVSNNWLAVTGTGAANTVQDTGIAVSATAPNVLVVILTSANAYFYIDGVLKNTINTTLPAASTYGPSIGIVKTAGTNARQIRAFNPGYHNRHPAYTLQ